MDGSIFEVVGLVVFGIIAGLSWHHRRETERESNWGRKRLAESLGLTYEPAQLLAPAELKGTLDGFPVSVKWRSGGEDGDSTSYELSGLPGLTMKKEDLGTGVRKALGAQDRQTGDADFDREVFLGADEMLGAVFFDPEVRGLARSVLNAGGRVADLDLSATHHTSDSVATVGATLRQFSKFAAAVADRRRNFAAYLLGAVSKPWGGARVLRLLHARLPGAPETKEAATWAQSSKSPELRLLSAIARGAHAEVRTMALDPATPPAILSQAVEALLETSPELLDATFEPPLLHLLAREDVELRTFAARALAHAGTVAAVPPLFEIAEALLIDRTLKDAARQAVGAIQGRLSSASAGQLALVHGEAQEGALSESLGEGALSVRNDDE